VPRPLSVSDLEPQVTLPWLIRLRWLALLGQISALLSARLWFSMDLDWRLLLPLLALLAASNAALSWWIERGSSRFSAAHLMGAISMLDVALLTALLGATGASSNPFTVLYLVHITLSAVVLSARWTTLLSLLSVAGFGSLFLLPAGPHAHHAGAAGFDHHLHGMWVAFVLAAGLSGFFIRRVVQAIAVQREEIAMLRELGAQNARLAALTTLAAGAAHELGSPLCTIAVAAHEAEFAVRKLAGAEGAADDLRLILLEVDRCQSILGKMAARASQTGDGAWPLSLGELAQKIGDHLGAEHSACMDLSVCGTGDPLHMPGDSLAQCVAGLIKNAIDASAAGERVTVTLTANPTNVEILVADRGSGMSSEVLSKVGEPFFTTKQPGSGLGLGVFLTRVFVESLGGALSIDSRLGSGTRALLRLPRAARVARLA
jgi:two-component system sensor histidine kinase RegB